MQEKLTELFPVLRGLPREDLQAIVSSGSVIRAQAGGILTGNVQVCPFVPLVLSGTLRIYILSPEGREVTLFYAGPGDFCLLGIACRMKSGELPAVVEAQEDAELFTLPAAVYERYLEPNAAWNRFLFATLYRHLYDSMVTFENVLFTRGGPAPGAIPAGAAQRQGECTLRHTRADCHAAQHGARGRLPVDGRIEKAKHSFIRKG